MLPLRGVLVGVPVYIRISSQCQGPVISVQFGILQLFSDAMVVVRAANCLRWLTHFALSTLSRTVE